MKRGSLYWVNLEPSDPPEFGKLRPCLVVSRSEYNSRLPTVAVLPISSKAPEIWPLRLEIQVSALKKKSYLVVPGIRQVSKARLTKFIGLLSDKDLEQVDEALGLYVG
ncbi:MAG: type II toxin-antitoxin system PemK/MazF family toxin [Deltaproteobacteria bacterium]|nr:type II toxin-antitoxin system PemK/MazF family toxin [Deltaproteobacteria bacterium]